MTALDDRLMGEALIEQARTGCDDHGQPLDPYERLMAALLGLAYQLATPPIPHPRRPEE